MLRNRVSGRILTLVLSGPVLVASWTLSQAVLASAKGFEATDEALYLLVSRDIAGGTQWGFPFGWHTAPIYLLAGQDVSNFRTLGAVILGLLGATLGFVAFLVTLGTDCRKSKPASKAPFLLPAAFVAVGYAGSLLYYASLLRSPSYNWVNLVGLLISTIGLLALFRRIQMESKSTIERDTLFFSFIISFGLFYAFPGKPSSPFLFLMAAIPVLVLLLGWRAAIRVTIQIVVFAIAILVVAVLTNMWPQDFYRYFFSAVLAPPLIDSYAISSALLELVQLPLAMLSEILADRVAAILLLVAAASSSSFWAMKANEVVGKRVRSLFMATSWALIVWLFVGRAALFNELDALGSWARSETGISLFLFFFLSLLVFGASRPRADSVGKLSDAKRTVFLSSLLLAWVPVVFAFGSTNPLLGQAAHAGGAFLVAGMMLWSSVSNSQTAHRMSVFIPSLTLVVVGMIITQSHRFPYRMEPIAEQSVPVRLLDGGQSLLYVDRETARFHQEVQRKLVQEGFEQGTPMIAIEWTWSAALPYSLGAAVLPSAMPTLFGYEGSSDRLLFNLEGGCLAFPCDHAWIVTTDPESIDAPSRKILGEASQILEGVLGRSLNSDYLLVTHVGDTLIFKPRG